MVVGVALTRRTQLFGEFARAVEVVLRARDIELDADVVDLAPGRVEVAR